MQLPLIITLSAMMTPLRLTLGELTESVPSGQYINPFILVVLVFSIVILPYLEYTTELLAFLPLR